MSKLIINKERVRIPYLEFFVRLKEVEDTIRISEFLSKNEYLPVTNLSRCFFGIIGTMSKCGL